MLKKERICSSLFNANCFRDCKVIPCDNGGSNCWRPRISKQWKIECLGKSSAFKSCLGKSSAFKRNTGSNSIYETERLLIDDSRREGYCASWHTLRTLISLFHHFGSQMLIKTACIFMGSVWMHHYCKCNSLVWRAKATIIQLLPRYERFSAQSWCKVWIAVGLVIERHANELFSHVVVFPILGLTTHLFTVF